MLFGIALLRSLADLATEIRFGREKSKDANAHINVQVQHQIFSHKVTYGVTVFPRHFDALILVLLGQKINV